MITVVCWKWKPEQGSRHFDKRRGFSADHVNRLRAAVERNTTVPHRFVCVTDNWKGLRSDIDVVNIDRHFPEFKELGGCYRRLKAFDFATGLALFGNRFVSVDLDVLVVGNLDPILSFTEDFKVWKDRFRRRAPFCGSLWGMRAGARQFVWDKFRDDTSMSVELMRRLKFVGTDQAHISAQLFDRHEATWGIEDGIYNFNTRVRRQASRIYDDEGNLAGIKRIDGNIPKGARMVFFNGKFDPSQPTLHHEYHWIRKLWNG